jgi:tRNA threonylcarbamoyl adenosine modification protein YeaZ
MTILLIETATTTCGAGLMVAGETDTLIVDRNRNHTEFLTEGIQQLLSSHGLTPRDVTRVVVDRGPGLYTGLRVGIATAIGLANGLGIELVGVTSLEMLARGAFDAGVRGDFVGLIDGRRSEVFAQHFFLSDHVEPLADPLVTTPAEVIERVKGLTSLTLWGDGVTKYLDQLQVLTNAALTPLEIPPLEAGLKLGAEARDEGAVVPLYLRDPDAVANFTTREQR